MGHLTMTHPSPTGRFTVSGVETRVTSRNRAMHSQSEKGAWVQAYTLANWLRGANMLINSLYVLETMTERKRSGCMLSALQVYDCHSQEDSDTLHGFALSMIGEALSKKTHIYVKARFC